MAIRFHPERGRPKANAMRPLAAAAAAFSLLSCDPELPKKPVPPEVPRAAAVESSRDKAKPYPPPPNHTLKASTKEMVEQLPKMQFPPAYTLPPSHPEKRCGWFCRYLAWDFPDLAVALHERVTKRKDDMKLTYDEAMRLVFHIKSAFYMGMKCRVKISYMLGLGTPDSAIGLFRGMREPKKNRENAGAITNYLLLADECRAKLFDVVGLVNKMPNTAIALLRGMSEQKVREKDAEGMADYLLRFLESTKISEVKTFDEYISRVIGREWSEMDDFGGKRPKRMRRVKNLKGTIYLQRFLQAELQTDSFKRFFAPKGEQPGLGPECPCRARIVSWGTVKIIDGKLFHIPKPLK